MKILRLTMLAVAFLLLNAASCTDEENGDKLPPETQSGNSTFGCLVNGKVWLPEGVPFSTQRTVTWVNEKYTYLVIGANQGPSQSLGLVINGTEIKSNMVYTLNSDSNSNSTYSYKCEKGSYCYYQSSSNYTGQLIITKFDTINKIVSGRFSFKAMFVEAQASDGICDSSIINITEGRFDLKYSFQP
jgi:hypothetical protein